MIRVINKEQNYFRLNESIRAKGDRPGDIENTEKGLRSMKYLDKMRDKIWDRSIKIIETIRKFSHIPLNAERIQSVRTQKSQRLRIRK